MTSVEKLKQEWRSLFEISPQTPESLAVVPRKMHLKNITDRRNIRTLRLRRSVKKHGKSPASKIRVYIGNKIIYNEFSAAETFVEAIKEAGITKVKELNLIVNNFELISNQRHPEYRQIEANGYYVMTNTSNDYKVRILNEIAKLLRIDMRTEIVYFS